MDRPSTSLPTTLGLAGLRLAAFVAGSAALAWSATPATAQSFSTSLSPYTYGYGFSPGELTRPIDVTTRDLSGNKVITDGVTQIGSDQSVFAKSSSTGAVDAFSGAGALGGASAIGNSLNVTVQGNYNTVIVNSTQTNTGNISASNVLNGKVDLNGQ